MTPVHLACQSNSRSGYDLLRKFHIDALHSNLFWTLLTGKWPDRSLIQETNTCPIFLLNCNLFTQTTTINSSYLTDMMLLFLSLAQAFYNNRRPKQCCPTLVSRCSKKDTGSRHNRHAHIRWQRSC